MNGELENLKEQLKEVQSKLETLKGEKAKLDELKNNGNLSDNLNEYYDSIDKAILACENIIVKIKEKIDNIESKKESVENKIESNSYRLSKGMIPYSTIDVYRQMTNTTKPEENIPDDVVIDIEPEEYEESEEDYLTKDRRKRIAEKAVIAALLVGIGASAAKLYEEVKKVNNQKNTTIEQPVVPENDSNIAYDYEENVVTITPEPTPSNPFINVAGYNETYLKDYEDAMNRYNILAEKAVDYVNRAHIIQDNYHFFAETSINEVVEVIMAIDQRELMTNENNNVADSINSSLNTVLDGVLWKGLTDADIAKLDAIPYFAEEGTDLNIHLKDYSRLAKDAIVNQTEEAYNNMYQYLQIFTLSQFDNTLAVNIIEPDGSITERPINESTVETVGTVTRELYDAATVNNVYDWWIACNSFIKPLYTTYFPYDYSDERVRRWEDLECIMNSGMEDPIFDEVCSNSLTLGGE